MSGAPTPDRMRHALGHFATGVTIVSGYASGGEPVGFACQSFASVSLHPPLVLFCADHRGRAWPRIRLAGRFAVNVLREDQGDVCARFGSSRGRKFDGLDWHESPWGTPAIGDVLLRVHCVVHDVHRAGDHDVVIGRVLELDSREAATEDERPMVFYRGAFGIDRVEANLSPAGVWARGDHWG